MTTKRYNRKSSGPLRTPQQWLSKALWAAAIRARASDLAFEVDRSLIDLPEVCPILGVRLEYGVLPQGSRSERQANLDRRVPALGYRTSNLRVISFRANRLKSDATAEELIKILAYLTP